MQIFGVSEKELNPGELFEDFHQRMELRNKISNALVALSLIKCKCTSKNLKRYIADGLTITDECIKVLGEMAEKDSSYKYYGYASKVLIDLLTDRLSKDPDQGKLQEYKKRFSMIDTTFKSIESGQMVEERELSLAEQALRKMDSEIESAYLGEENLYRGSFVAR